MKLFKIHYMSKDTVYQLHSLIEKNIRRSYTGGAVDVYIPHNRKNSFLEVVPDFNKLFYYDVNSLYPSRMANYTIPVGKPITFEGDIRQVEPNAFGFFYCKIDSPYNIEHPILQRRIKTSEGLRTIAGLGYWEGWIFSKEMDNAMKLGYKFEILKGYQFEEGNIFEVYINDLYKLRLEYPKGDPMNMIAKLLMNSLYGKFGMKDEMTKLEILNNKSELDKEIISTKLEYYKNNLIDMVELEDHIIIVSKQLADLKYNQKEEIFHGSEVNIAIASAITAYARIHMSNFKNNPNFNLYYSDTDSVVIDKALSDNMVGNKLGQVKLEYTISKAVFLAPKVYGLITEDGKEIIKAKGLTKETIKNINVSDLELLLKIDSNKIFKQEKAYKYLFNSEYLILDTAYTLKATSNKRQLIYLNGIFNSTKPFNYEEIT